MLPKAYSIVFCQLTSSLKDSGILPQLLGLRVLAPVTPPDLQAGTRRWQSPSWCRNGRRKIRRSCLSRLISPVDSPCLWQMSLETLRQT